MNINEIKGIKSTVLSTERTDNGTEVWVRYEGGREHAYTVPSQNFQAREGHELTEMQYQGRPVAILNNATNRKFQILTGYSVLGAGPQVEPKPRGFWFGYFLLALPIILVGNSMVADSYSYWEHHWFEHWIANIYCFITSVGGLVILPLRFIFWQDVKKFRHGRKVKAVNAVILQAYDKL